MGGLFSVCEVSGKFWAVLLRSFGSVWSVLLVTHQLARTVVQEKRSYSFLFIDHRSVKAQVYMTTLQVLRNLHFGDQAVGKLEFVRRRPVRLPNRDKNNKRRNNANETNEGDSISRKVESGNHSE